MLAAAAPPCLDDARALAFATGELAPDERAAIEDHVDECAQCRSLLAALVARTRDPAQRTNADRDAWQAGTRVGRYVIRGPLGHGAMGAVFRAQDLELSREVALKRLHGTSDDARDRLAREARAAAQLQHPNVVAVYDVGEVDGAPFIAMELVDGMTSTSWLARGRGWRDVVAMMQQAGRGLHAAHIRGLVHRDFKLDNVLVDHGGRARVADFGLARDGGFAAIGVSGDLRATHSALAGTPAYLAPELVAGGAPDAKSDQYAFAIALFQALHGRHPFPGDSAEMMWLAMAEGTIRDGGGDVPAWLERTVRRGLAVDPADRWPDIASLVAAIEPPKRSYAVIAAVGVACAALAVAAIALLVPRREHVEPSFAPEPKHVAAAIVPTDAAIADAFADAAFATADVAIAVPSATPPKPKPKLTPTRAELGARYRDAFEQFHFESALELAQRIYAVDPSDNSTRLVVTTACWVHAHVEDDSAARQNDARALAVIEHYNPKLTPYQRRLAGLACEGSGINLPGPFQRGPDSPVEQQ